MKKHIAQLTALCLVMILLVGSLTGCNGSKKDVENLMTEFQYSCNTLDIDAMLNCIDPSVSDPIKLGLGLYGMFAQKDKDQILDEIASALSGNSDMNGNDFFSSIKIDVQKVDVKGKDAQVETVLQYKLLGENFKRDASFSCIQNAGKSYISSFNFG